MTSSPKWPLRLDDRSGVSTELMCCYWQWYLGYGEDDWRERVNRHIHSDEFSAFR
jgi:hypothetical protein